MSCRVRYHVVDWGKGSLTTAFGALAFTWTPYPPNKAAHTQKWGKAVKLNGISSACIWYKSVEYQDKFITYQLSFVCCLPVAAESNRQKNAKAVILQETHSNKNTTCRHRSANVCPNACWDLLPIKNAAFYVASIYHNCWYWLIN